MGVTDEVMAKVRAASNHTDGNKALDEAKDICRRGFKSAAMNYHPDLHQHLPADELAEKSEQFKQLKSVCDDYLESRYQGPRASNTRRAASNFDPFGFQAAANQEMDDDLRYWDDPLLRNFMRAKRAAERDRAQRYGTSFEERKKRIYWNNLGLDYDEMKAREARKPKEKVVALAGNKGVWFPERGRWILKTCRPKKSPK